MRLLSYPFTYSFFNGTHNVISHMAYPRSVRIGLFDRSWTFFVVARTPCTIVLGLDTIQGWPLFYSPLDDRLFVVKNIQGQGDAKRAITNGLLDSGNLVSEAPEPYTSMASLHHITCPPEAVLTEPTASTPHPHLLHPTHPHPALPLFWEPPTPEELSPKDKAFSKLLNPHRGFVVACDYDSPDSDKAEDINIVAEDVVDFMRVSLSPWSVE